MSEDNLLKASVDELYDDFLFGLKKASKEFSKLIEQKICADKIDGQIIGTGVADFTKDNVNYSFEHNKKEFQLIDVPGIEGHESQYEHMVKAAVAKAHIVFFVNGTAKKPEVGTAQKIKKYLRHGTNLQPIINVRGFADQYEFTEDRTELANKAIKSASEQTYEVLKNELGADVVMQPLAAQGLLAFSGLAYKEDVSTIHKSRVNDLGKIQKKYLETFLSVDEMLRFSNIYDVASVVKMKLETIDDEIVESNKRKAISQLDKSISILESQKENYIQYVANVKKEFKLCKTELDRYLEVFESDLKRKRRIQIEDYIVKIKEEADNIVEEHFGENDDIKRLIEKVVKSSTKNLYEILDDILKKELNVFSKNAMQVTERLLKNIENSAEKIAMNDFGVGVEKLTLSRENIFNLKNIGSWALNIGGYAASGFALGTFFPGLGNLVGGIAGAIVGILKSVWDFFSSKEKRVRKMQHQIHDMLDEMNDELLTSEKSFIKEAVSKLTEYKKELELQLDKQLEAIVHPLNLIEKNIKFMSDINIKMKGMPYGTI